MFHPRNQTQFAAGTAVSSAGIFAADLDAIARIESSLDRRVRRTPLQGRPDFSRLARFVPGLQV